MKKTINLGSIKMPATAATKAFALLAKRGAGKSYTGAVMAEEFAKANIPFVVFDPIDVWWGLRLAANGKDKGLPIVVFGLQHADIPLDRTMGKKIARAVVDENISCVISTFGMPKVAMRELIADFSEELLNINNTPRHVFIEEAHEFVPQRVFGAGARCFAAVEALLVMGRNRGIGVTLINQRAATINKDLLTQIDTLIALRSVGPQDRKALSEWVEAHAAEGDFSQFINSLPSLPTGEAWIWSPEFMEIFERIQIRKRETFHPDREKLGMNFKMPDIKQGDIASFIEKFSTKKKVEDPKVTAHGAVKPQVISKEVLMQEFKRGYQAGLLSKDKLREKIYQELLRSHNNVEIALQRMKESIGQLKIEEGRLVAGEKIMAYSPVVVKENNIVERAEIVSDGSITGGAMRMLKALAARKTSGLTRQQLATIADVKVSGGSFSTYISRLKANQYITADSDKIYITEHGINFVGEIDEISGDQVIDMWMKKLTGGARRMFEVVLKNAPGYMSKQQLAFEANVEMTGGSFSTYLSRLKSNGLVEITSDGIKISEILIQ